MLKTLIKKQLLEMFQMYFVDRKTGKKRSKSGTLLFFCLFGALFAFLGFAIFSMASELGRAILDHAYNWLYFALMGLLAMVLGVFGSVFNTYASVYLPKDNEFLLSLPIPPRTLLLARLSGVYVTSLMYSALVWIPALIAYFILVPVNPLNILCPILLTLIIALFVFVLSCLLGFVVALFAAKAKGKSYITLIVSIAVFALYYFVYFKIVGSIGEVITHIDEIGNTVKSWLHYAYLLGKGADGDLLSMVLVTSITVLLAVCCFLILSRSFAKLSTVSGSERKKSGVSLKYRKRTESCALIIREFKHFSAVPTWMLNGGFSLLILPVVSVVFLIKSQSIRSILPEIAAEIPELYDFLPIVLLLSACLVLSINAILPVSVSMEGKTLWQLQSLPIQPAEILHAKERMCMMLSVFPAAFYLVVCGFVLNLHFWETALVCLGTWLYIRVISGFGLFLNLKMPNFNWTNAATLTKQSAPVVISMFGGFAFTAALGIGCFFLTRLFNHTAILIGLILLFAILRVLLHQWLKVKGTAIFASL